MKMDQLKSTAYSNSEAIKQHRAKPRQWDAIASAADIYSGSWGDCILELRSRVEALEIQNALNATNSQSSPNDRQIRSSADHFGQVNKMVPASSLVKIVECAIEDCSEKDYNSYQPEARAAIRAIAAWLRDRGFTWVAQVLELEADR